MNTQTLLKYAPWALFGGLAAYAAYVFWPRPVPAESAPPAASEPTSAIIDWASWWAQVTWTPPGPDQGDMGDTSVTPL